MICRGLEWSGHTCLDRLVLFLVRISMWFNQLKYPLEDGYHLRCEMVSGVSTDVGYPHIILSRTHTCTCIHMHGYFMGGFSFEG